MRMSPTRTRLASRGSVASAVRQPVAPAIRPNLWTDITTSNHGRVIGRVRTDPVEHEGVLDLYWTDGTPLPNQLNEHAVTFVTQTNLQVTRSKLEQATDLARRAANHPRYLNLNTGLTLRGVTDQQPQPSIYSPYYSPKMNLHTEYPIVVAAAGKRPHPLTPVLRWCPNNSFPEHPERSETWALTLLGDARTVLAHAAWNNPEGIAALTA